MTSDLEQLHYIYNILRRVSDYGDLPTHIEAEFQGEVTEDVRELALTFLSDPKIKWPYERPDWNKPGKLDRALSRVVSWSENDDPWLIQQELRAILEEGETDFERDFLTSPGEHLDVDCWCHHPREEHDFDPVRDYRELRCRKCNAERLGLQYPPVRSKGETDADTP